MEDINSSALPLVASREDPDRSNVVITLTGATLIGVLCLPIVLCSDIFLLFRFVLSSENVSLPSVL